MKNHYPSISTLCPIGPSMMLRTVLLLLLYISTSHSTPPPDRMAILSIQNTTGLESSYVEAMPDMIVSEILRIAPDQQLVERRQVEAAMRELQLDIGGLTEEGSRRIGQWVGAERIMVGTLSSLGNDMRLDLRIIQVESGRILQAGNASIQRNKLQELVPLTVHALQGPTQDKASASRKSDTIVVTRLVSVPTPVEKGQATLRIRYRAILSLLTQKAVPLQQVRVYCNNRLIGTSPILDAVNKDFYIYNGPIPSGTIELRLEHGMINKSGEWKSLFSEQPDARILSTHPGDHVELEYQLRVGSSHYRFTSL
jgi:hypothetical protein